MMTADNPDYQREHERTLSAEYARMMTADEAKVMRIVAAHRLDELAKPGAGPMAAEIAKHIREGLAFHQPAPCPACSGPNYPGRAYEVERDYQVSVQRRQSLAVEVASPCASSPENLPAYLL